MIRHPGDWQKQCPFPTYNTFFFFRLRISKNWQAGRNACWNYIRKSIRTYLRDLFGSVVISFYVFFFSCSPFAVNCSNDTNWCRFFEAVLGHEYSVILVINPRLIFPSVLRNSPQKERRCHFYPSIFLV